MLGQYLIGLEHTIFKMTFGNNALTFTEKVRKDTLVLNRYGFRRIGYGKRDNSARELLNAASHH